LTKNINSRKTTIKMRNYTEAVVLPTEVFRGDYRIALSWARNRQAELKKAEVDNISYTIEGQEGKEGVVTKHEGKFGGVPPYQPLIHNSKPVSLTNQD
jgi:hypothetical protein